MKAIEHTSDHIVIRIDFGFEWDADEVEKAINHHQQRLTSEGFSILQTARKDGFDGTSMLIEAMRFTGEADLDG